ncbi:MAG TPA: DUF5916 domain-containing protein [Usitatibacter sp.]|jgi:hypothetical protein|nr:DUF5916 domain-containing protein [Usitatibacter sp.]
MRKTCAAILLTLLHVAPADAVEVLRLAPGETIELDGRLDEPAWQRAAVLDRFWENYPQADIEAPVRTEARFAADGRALYVALRAFDPDLGVLRAPFARRDNVLADQDMLILFLDPVGARKFAHFYRVNPRGSIGDGLYNEDSGTEDFSPDFDFEVVTGRFEGGWTAEFRIPFSTLRYADAARTEWSVMIWRNYPRDQRYRMSSSKLPREQTCFLCLNEPLTGLTALPSPRFLQLTPNATLRSVETWGSGVAHETHREFVPSLDAKWRPRSDVVVDATLNPDFSQVELDTPQLAGNAQFALFYPEKRPFFLEGADILQGPISAIYTRSVTDPAWGVRGTQRRDGFDGTVLVTRDDGGGLVLLPNTYTTNFAAQDFKSYASFARARWQHDGFTFGAVATDRTLDGGAYNRVAGPDAVWFPTNDHRLRLQVLGSWTTAQAVDGHLARGELATSHSVMADWSYRGPAWEEYVDLEDVGRDFRADNGFVGQNGYRRLYSETTRKFLDVGRFNEVSPYFFAENKTAPDGSLQYRQTHLGLRLGLPRATTIAFEYRPNDLVAVRPGGGTRKRDQVYLSLESNPWPWFSRFFFESAIGDRLDVLNNRIGRGAYASLQASIRPHPRAEIEYRIDNDTIDALESVEGSRRIIGQRVQQFLAIWHFSARDSLRTIWQSTAVRRAPSLWEAPVSPREDTNTLSLVYGYRRRLGTAFYVGANLTRDRDAGAASKAYQVEVFAKASWTLDIL